ncbi:type I-E CRISPR-associated protein Cas6/Cse3/CasE [soil metagenome]
MSELYLSRLVLNPRNRLVQRDLADCRALHQRIMQGFPGTASAQPRQTFGVLYRVEVDDRTGIPLLLVQANTEPDWKSALHTGYLLDAERGRNPDTKRIDEQYGGLREKTELQFRLRANPTKRLSPLNEKAGTLSGKRVELPDESQQLEWLQRKGIDSGFRLVSARAQPGDFLGSKQTGRSANTGSDLRFATVVFDGRLVVADAERFRATLSKGIGPGKAFGFGLLSVAPAGH